MCIMRRVINVSYFDLGANPSILRALRLFPVTFGPGSSEGSNYWLLMLGSQGSMASGFLIRWNRGSNSGPLHYRHVFYHFTFPRHSSIFPSDIISEFSTPLYAHTIWFLSLETENLTWTVLNMQCVEIRKVLLEGCEFNHLGNYFEKNI